MIEKFNSINYKKIKRISPSQFHSIKNCAYKSILAEAFEKKALLPISPNAYYGSVLHKILEFMARGLVRTEEDFDMRFDAEIAVMENHLSQEGYSSLIPLQKNVKDFGLKKALLKKHLKNAIPYPKQKSGTKFTPEKWFEANDGSIGGKIDLIIEEGENVEIIDFKTGAITEDVLDDSGEIFIEIKNEYQEQLKLYAYLYFESTGKFPTHLTIVDIAKNKYIVEFSLEECAAIFKDAKDLLHETNKSIDTKSFNANPNEKNCKFCLYRPACSYYLSHLLPEDSINDIYGIVKDVVQHQNGVLTLYLEYKNNTFLIRGFPNKILTYFIGKLNKQISIFNLRKEAVDRLYSTTKATIVYE
jgi:CRISPR/Cas system-associated exonuclease Cas4 (RecB family)